MSIKIVFFTDHFVPEISAPAAHIFDRCKIWVEQGHDVTVVTNVPNYPLGEPYKGYKNRLRTWETISGIKVLRVVTYMAENKGTIKRTLDYISFAISSFFNSLAISKPDVVYSTSPHIFAPLGAIAFSLVKRVPHVLEVRDLWPESIAATTGMSRSSVVYRGFELIERLLYNSSKNIVVFTESFKNHLVLRGVLATKLHVVINGANIALFEEPVYDEGLDMRLDLHNKFVVGYMGTHGLSHDLLNAVHAASLVQDEGIFFLFVGEGAEKAAMVTLAKQLDAKNIRFVERQAREDIPKYWSLCDVGLVHLKNDPVFETVIPSKIFETMAAGRPIMYCGPDSDGSRLIKGYDCGLVTNSDDPDALAKALISLKRDLALRQRLAMNGKKAAPKFSREVQAEATMHVLELASDLSKGEK
jgi:glycosyltransferase involved in cell wall biosynthesis